MSNHSENALIVGSSVKVGQQGRYHLGRLAHEVSVVDGVAMPLRVSVARPGPQLRHRRRHRDPADQRLVCDRARAERTERNHGILRVVLEAHPVDDDHRAFVGHLGRKRWGIPHRHDLHAVRDVPSRLVQPAEHFGGHLSGIDERRLGEAAKPPVRAQVEAHHDPGSPPRYLAPPRTGRPSALRRTG